MLRSKVILISLILPVVAAIGVLGFAIFRDRTVQQEFSESGYILLSPDSAYSDQINSQIYFEQGSRFKTKYTDRVVFKDQQKRTIAVGKESFVHYNDNSIGALSDGVLIDLNDLKNPTMNYYGLTPNSVMESTGKGYILDNMGASIPFSDFLWKISDTKYLLASDSIQMNLSDKKTMEFKDYVELTYYDTGIVRIVTQEGTWQTVSSDCNAKLGNGVAINLASRTILDDSAEKDKVKLSLEQMVIDSDANIIIMPTTIISKEVKVPKFDIKTIDGTAGNAGEAGKNGEAGEGGLDGTEGEAGQKGEAGTGGTPGKPGDPGTTGVTGVNGVNGPGGSSGANGAAGGNGNSGENADDDVTTDSAIKAPVTVLPVFELTKLVSETNSVFATITVSDAEKRLDVSKPFQIQILKNSTGEQVHKAEIDSSNVSFDVEYNGLLPNSEYRLVLTAEYTVDNVNYSRVFLNKLFETDSLGLTVTKKYATSNSLAFTVKTAGYSEILSAGLQLTDEKGAAVKTLAVDILASSDEDGVSLVFDGLTSNSLYCVKVVEIKLDYDSSLVVPPETTGKEYWTLKKPPVLGKPVVVVNKRDGCFDMQLESVTDEDGAIVNYRYDLYEVGTNNTANNTEKLVKSLYSTKKDVLPCYVDGSVIKNGYYYYVKVVAECNDNEKKVEYASPLSDLFSMTGSNYPVVLFEKDAVQFEHIKGTLRISTNGSVLTVDSANPLIVQYKNSVGNVDSYTLTDVSTYTQVSGSNTLYTIPFDEQNLLANDNYTISVYGTVDLNDGAGPRKRNHIGSVVVNTTAPTSLQAILLQQSSQTHPIAFTLSLADASVTTSSAYEASTIKYVDVNIYNGDETSVANTRPVATYRMTGDKGSSYQSTLKDQLYGTGKSVLITEAEFGITNTTITSSKYTIEVSLVQDYTKYGNEIGVVNNIKTFSKTATLPAVTPELVNNGLVVTPITLSNIGQYVADITPYTAYDANIIFGYEVSAAYFNNNTELIDNFTYYAFEEYNGDPSNYSSAQSFYSSVSAVASITKQVDQVTGLVPSAVFLFGQGQAVSMSRGSRYIFTYRAQLKAPDVLGNTAFFPDSVSSSAIAKVPTVAAPYQTPKFYLYPWLSGTSSMTWRYSIVAPDSPALVGTFYPYGAGTVNPANVTGGSILVTGLNNGNAYTLRHQTRRYKQEYDTQSSSTTAISLAGQYFETPVTLDKDTTSLSYSMQDMTTQNRYVITVLDSDTDASDLSRITALQVHVYPGSLSASAINITVPIESVTGTVATGYLPYSALESYVNNTLYFKMDAVYDNGVSGFSGLASTDADHTRAIQIMPGLTKGNYISLNSSGNGIAEDTTATAKGSWFRLGNTTGLNTTASLTCSSIIDATYSNQPLNITLDQTGARLENLASRPRFTLKTLRNVLLPVTDSVSRDTVISFNLQPFTPTVTLNRGAAYTIDTTIDSATVHWTINGHAEQISAGAIQGNNVYFDLYEMQDSGILGTPAAIAVTTISAITNDYTTNFTGLKKNTKYGFQIYYLSADGTTKVYPIDSYRPDKVPSTLIYSFTTNSNVVITPGSPAFTNVINSYRDKYLQLNYSLNQTLGFNIEYSICKKQGPDYTEVLSSAVMSARGIIQTPAVNRNQMTSEQLLMRPGELYWDESGTRVYFPYESTEYYLCIKPVSKTNNSLLLGSPAYIQLNVPAPITPFYNIKAVPDTNQVTFQVSVLDSGMVMVNGHYKIRVLNGTGGDITPAAYKDVIYSISNPASIPVSNVAQDDKAVLRIYSVYDLKNTGLYQDGSALEDIGNVTYANLDTAGKGYLKISYTGYPLDNRGYDLGDVQIAQYSTEMARIYFTNPVNLGKLKYIQYVVINASGTASIYNEPFSPVATSPTLYYYQLSHRFSATGVYQVQVRFYDESMNKLEDLVLTLYKNL